MTRTSQFGEALQGAVDKALREETRGLPAPDKARMIRELLGFYRRHRATIDLAVEGALRLSGSSEQLASSLRKGPAPGQLDGEAARALLGRAELQPIMASAQAEGVAAVSVGLSLGLDLIIGGAAGADVLIDVDTNEASVRGFAVLDLGLDVFAGIGLNLGIWQALPTIDKKMYTGGLLIDVPTVPVIRIMAVREGTDLKGNPSGYRLLGFTIAVNLGAGGGVMVYRGPQYTLGLPSRRVKLTVRNCTDGADPPEPGTSSIAQNVSSTLLCTLENTTGTTITIGPGSELTLNLPSYFTSDDASAIEVTPPSDWTSEGWTGGALTLQYAGTDTLDWTGSLDLTLANARPSQPDPVAGQVTVRIPDAVIENATVDKPGIFANASLTLVPAIKYATISVWTANYPDFTLVAGQPSSGTNVTVSSQENQNDVIPLTQITDSDGTPWTLGCQFYIEDTTQAPCFRACWYEEGTFVKYGKTLFAPNFMTLTQPGQVSTAYYGNNEGNPNTVQITVTLNS